MRRLLASLTLSAVAVAGVTLTSFAESASASTGTKYYVNCAAKTNGDGSSDARAWKTLSAVQAHGAFAPGDQILLHRGKTCGGTLAPQGSGTKGKPIVLGAYGSGSKPLIRGGGSADRTAVISLANQSYWTVQDLHVTNTSGGRTTKAYRAGVRVVNAGGGVTAGITLQRLQVDSVTSSMSPNLADSREWGGITAITYTSGTDHFSDLIIRNNRIDHVGRTGIIVSNNGYPRAKDTGVQVSANRITWTRGDGILVRGVTKARINNNTVGHASDEWPCPDCGPITPQTANAAIWTANSRNVRIDHNEAYGTKYLGGDGEGFDADASAVDTVIEYNYSHDNEGGGILFCGSSGAVVRFNILENNKKSALAFIGSMPAKNTSIYNNTIYVSKKSNAGVVRYFNGAHGSSIKFYNNIVYSFAKGYYMWPTKVWSRNNTYVGTHNRGEPRGAGYTWTSPSLKSPGSGGTGMSTLKGYKPAHPSTSRKGIAISKSVTRDFFGKKINPKHPTRGAAG